MSENKKELPTKYSIDLSTYYMDDYASSVELEDWINAYLKDEFGKEPYSYECDVDEDDDAGVYTADLSNIVWEKPKDESLDEGKTVQTKKQLDDDVYVEYSLDDKKYYLASDYDRYIWTNFDSIEDAESFYKYHKNDVRNSILEKLEEPKTEEKLTEAPDDDGILSDDDLDAEEQRERDEMEARFKARRDKVAQQRTDRDAKIARQNELKAQAETKLKEIGNDWSFEHLFDTLVPDSGKCDTLAGEIVRAINKIEYRWFNDGDRFNEDYGIETCGQSALFLANIEVDDEKPFMDILLHVDVDNDDLAYERLIEELKDEASDLLKAHTELLATETTDMYDVNRRDVENWLEDENLIPTYDVDCSIPNELDAHLEKGNISERDLIWEVESWLENIGGARYSDVSVDWGNVYVNDCNRQVYNELDGGSTLYNWLEEYAQELNNEYGDPNGEEEEEPEEGEEDEQ